MMRALFVKELKQLCSAGNIILCLCLILAALLFSFVPKEKGKTAEDGIRIGVVDKDQSMYSSMLVNYFKEDKSFGKYATIVQGAANEVKSLFDQGKLDAYLVLPEQFAENLIHIQNTPIEVKINTNNIMTAVVIKNVLDSYEKYIEAVEVNAVSLYDIMKKEGHDTALIDRYNVKISAELVFTALGRQDFFIVEPVSDSSSIPMNAYYSYAFECLLLLYTGLYIGFALLKEKKNQATARGAAAGIKIYQYVIAKMGFSFLVIMFFITVFHTALAKGIGLTVHSAQYLVLAGTAFFSICFAVLLSFLCEREETYMTAGNMFHIVACIIGGAVIPISYLPEGITALSKFTPVYWMIRLMAA